MHEEKMEDIKSKLPDIQSNVKGQDSSFKGHDFQIGLQNQMYQHLQNTLA
jgi:hypothetical protein